MMAGKPAPKHPSNSSKPAAKKAAGGPQKASKGRPATTTGQRKSGAKKPAPTASKKARPANTASPAKVSPAPRARVPKNPPKPLGNKMGSASIPYQGTLPQQGAGPIGIGGV